MSVKSSPETSHGDRGGESLDARQELLAPGWSGLAYDLPIALCADQEVARKDKWVTVYQGKSDRCFKITNHGGLAGPGESIELEVEVDGKVVTTLGSGQSTRVCGKTIRIRAKSRYVLYSVTPF